MFQHILVPTDGTPFSDKALECAIDMATEGNVQVVALQVVPRSPINYYEGVVTMSPEDISYAESRLVGDAQAKLQTLVRRAEASGVQLKTAITVSDGIADAIIAAATKHGSDLIVMASHGRHGIARLLMGSETDRVLTHSKVPVLVVH